MNKIYKFRSDSHQHQTLKVNNYIIEINCCFIFENKMKFVLKFGINGLSFEC